MKHFLNRDYLYCDDKMKATRHKKGCLPQWQAAFNMIQSTPWKPYGNFTTVPTGRLLGLSNLFALIMAGTESFVP